MSNQSDTARNPLEAASEQPKEEYAKTAFGVAAICRSVEEAASVGAARWLSYLIALFYIGVAAGSVTNSDLLLQSPVKLPFLQVELPLIAFFILAPALLIIAHAYALVHFVILAAKVEALNRAFEEQLPNQSPIIEGLRRQLPSDIFVQFLAGPREINGSRVRLLLWAVAWVSLVFGPVLVLLMIEVQFLAYHLEWVTWVHRAVFFADVFLLWWLWPRVLVGRKTPGRRPFLIAGFLTFAAIAFSLLVVTFPGEFLDDWASGLRIIPPNTVTAWLGQQGWTSVHDLLFNGEIDEVARRRKSLFSNTLVLSDFDVLALGAAADDPRKLDTVEYSVNLRGRHLENAIFFNADLRKADFENAFLQGSRLSYARLQGATLRNASLEGASLQSAQLQGASLDKALLQGALLDNAQLQGAWLPQAKLQGASLKGAQLQGAWLEGARLQGASLVETQLQGANLTGASFRATALSGAYVWRAEFANVESFEALLQEKGLTWDQKRISTSQHVEPWTTESYVELAKKLEKEMPDGYMRQNALDRLEILDPLRHFADEAKVPEWRKAIAAAIVTSEIYQKALADELLALSCSDQPDATYLLRGLVNRSGERTPDRLEVALKPYCSISAILTRTESALNLAKTHRPFGNAAGAATAPLTSKLYSAR